MSKFKTTWSVKSVKYKTSCEFDLKVLDQELCSFELVQTGGVIHRNKQHETNENNMPKKLMSHELARILLKKPNSVVMVNGDFDVWETKLTGKTLEFGSKEDGWTITSVETPNYIRTASHYHPTLSPNDT